MKKRIFQIVKSFVTRVALQKLSSKFSCHLLKMLHHFRKSAKFYFKIDEKMEKRARLSEKSKKVKLVTLEETYKEAKWEAPKLIWKKKQGQYMVDLRVSTGEPK